MSLRPTTPHQARVPTVAGQVADRFPGDAHRPWTARGTAVAANVAQAVLHPVCCPYCATEFDLFAAAWCEHWETDASKICPHCTRCLCAHPAYSEPHFWKEAPHGFQQQGFRRLFLFYL